MLHKNIYLKQNYNILFLLLIPNIIFLIFAFFTKTSRPLINADYLLPLFFLIIPSKLSRIIGSLILIIVIFIDILMMTIQIFPFLDVDGIIYLAPFIMTAPSTYKIGIIFLILTIIFLVYILLNLTKNLPFTFSFLLLLFFAFLSHQNATILKFKYYKNPMRLGGSNYFIIHSQSLLLGDIFNDSWRKKILKNEKPSLIVLPEKEKNGTINLTKYSNKILLIVSESLGAMRNDEQNNEIFKHIISYKDNLEFFNISRIDFVGATVAGELRELCSLKLERGGYNFKNNSIEEFKNCLPNQYRANAFNTIGIHGASSRLYERDVLYEKLGFKERYFAEHFLDKKKCNPFHGVCDSELFDFIAEQFRNNEKLFFYWMTLTSHQPYNKKDIFNHRFDCKKFGMKPDGEICRNVKLQTQFFDQLAELIKKDEMKGVEVMVVGDHMPPFITSEKIYPFFRYNEVPVIHFKVKE